MAAPGCVTGPLVACARLFARALGWGPAPPPGDSLLKSFCDEVLGGGASLGSLYAYLNLSEALLVLRPTCRALASASKATPRLRAPLSIEPQDIEELVALLRGPAHTLSRQALASANAPEALLRKVTQLLRAANSVVLFATAKAPSLAGKLFRLALPFGLPNGVIRAWGRANLLTELTELHLLGSGGPSDAGLMHLAKLCPKLRRLTILGGQCSAASALLLQAQSVGAMSEDWWRGFRCTRLCILPRLQHTKLKGLSVQRVPSWFCGHWSPVMPTWGHEVHCYDSLGRFVCLRNGLVERIGVVRSLLPSQFGNWWELEISFLARQDAPSQLVLLLPLSGEGAAGSGGAWEPWAGVQKEPASIVRGAMVGPSDGVRDRPRRFPHPGHGHEWRRVSRECDVENILPWGIQEWAEAAISAGADDSVTMFFEGASSSEEGEGEGFSVMKSMEELLAQLDLDEARDWEAIRPSARVEVGSGSVPSIEELLVQLDVEDERDRSD